MENKEQGSALQSEESRRQKHDADSGNDGSSNEMLQKEKMIDHGNEHHHSGDTDDDNGTGSPSQHDADSGGDATGSMGPKPGEDEA